MPSNGRFNDKSAEIVGRVLRRVRETAGITQQDVAMRADMDRAYISEVENGKRSISVDRLLRVCEALNVRAATIISQVEKEIADRRKGTPHRAR